jgi:hypothetical protein
MADEEAGAVLKVEDPLRRRHVVCKRSFGLLHHGDLKALLD